jgi:hypothetical protein
MSVKQSPHEKKIVEKLELLLSLIEENYADSSDEYLIAPDQLDVIDILAKVKRGKLPERDDLMRMNAIWKTNQKIKKHGGLKEYEKSFWSEIDKYINSDNLIEATRILRTNMRNDKGELLGLKEAQDIISRRKKEIVS